MSDDHFHVHGPHEHEVEHLGQSGDDFAGRMAVTTAILATVGALFSYQGGATQKAALPAVWYSRCSRSCTSDSLRLLTLWGCRISRRAEARPTSNTVASVSLWARLQPCRISRRAEARPTSNTVASVSLWARLQPCR